MATATIPSVNKALRKQGINLDLWKGEGYHYFSFDDGKYYTTVSVMVCYTSHLSIERWMQEANDAMAVVNKELEALAFANEHNPVIRRMMK
ncbi:hypothetical protein UFOVP605_36 [uncultured Caudovirales phage]|uniref:Uncharacterized protein n=1 Tax=uncultured Caudovirales phage TaxID=2100421 RepID=A0A6J5N741_9CAUD|nr:hypothetical protein UFOVP605_36 [uncultured Caudovirales phage]